MIKNDVFVVHLIYKLDVGGLEKVMLECIKNTQNKGIQHAVIALTEITSFAENLPNNVQTYSLNKKPGSDLGCHIRLYKLLKTLKPTIIQTYNIATIEYHPISWLAGIKGHIHAEHGRDIYDPKGVNKKHNFLRKIMSLFIQRYIAVSLDLTQWLLNYVGINKNKVKLIYNGIDTNKFASQANTKITRRALNFDENIILFGAVSRLTPIKDHKNLIQAFSLVIARQSKTSKHAKLVIVGDGPLYSELAALIAQLNLTNHVYLIGERNDIDKILPELNVYVMSSIAEGIPLAILEAMSAGLPIISTLVGGIPELLENEKQGLLVPAQNSEKLANAMLWMLEHEDLAKNQGKINKEVVKNKFSINTMVNSYLKEYKGLK